jgi:hypothetical protein
LKYFAVIAGKQISLTPLEVIRIVAGSVGLSADVQPGPHDIKVEFMSSGGGIEATVTGSDATDLAARVVGRFLT